ncbi:hypothetical protein CEXT_670991 [Caerostris extrusa]|uniref:Uncharacterized protein n=1 Tax=Caerostris extrusa TaxID=172846 RepID=A0AAV4RUU0_CAEEX|nr:hypothetical protein CEXT_670991 [Caerostris extrusa]
MLQDLFDARRETLPAIETEEENLQPKIRRNFSLPASRPIDRREDAEVHRTGQRPRQAPQPHRPRPGAPEGVLRFGAPQGGAVEGPREERTPGE